DVVQPVLVEPADEGHFEVTDPAGHGSSRHVPGAKVVVDPRQLCRQPLHGRSTLLDARHSGVSSQPDLRRPRAAVFLTRGARHFSRSTAAGTLPSVQSDTVSGGRERPMDDTPDEGTAADVTSRAGVAIEAPAAAAADRARDRLRALDDAPLEEHVEVYEDVHRQLQEGLADLDEG